MTQKEAPGDPASHRGSQDFLPVAGPECNLKLPRSPRVRRAPLGFCEEAPPSVWLCSELLWAVKTVALLVLSLMKAVGCIMLLELDSW